MTPIKALIVSSYDFGLNTIRSEAELILGLHRAGVDITLMAEGHTFYARRFRELGVRVIDHHPRRAFQWDTIRLIRHELITQGYQILHLFSNKAITNGVIAAIGLPVKVITYRGFAGNIHWWNPVDYLKQLHPRIDAIACVSPAVKEHLDRQLFFNPGKSVVITKGHDPAWYNVIEPASLTEFNLPNDAVVVSLVANARKMKGIPVLVGASHLLPPGLPVYFLMIGKNLDRSEFIEGISQSPYRSRFVFTGYRADALQLVKAADFSLLTSIKGEGLSKTLLEAMFLGKPAIFTDIPANRGLAVHGESGWIIPPGNAQELANAITRLVQDKSLREQLGQKAHEHVLKYYGIEQGIQQLLRLYRNLSGLP